MEIILIQLLLLFHHQFNQVVHELLQTDVVRDVVLVFPSELAVVRRRVQFALQDSLLGRSLVASDDFRVWNSVLHNHTGVFLGFFQQGEQMLVLWKQMIFLLHPLVDLGAMPYKDVEIGVNENDYVGLQLV